MKTVHGNLALMVFGILIRFNIKTYFQIKIKIKMLTEQQVIEIAKNYVKERKEKSGLDLVILDNEALKKPYGIIFFYNTKKYNDTRNDDDNTLLGNAPFLVENKTETLSYLEPANLKNIIFKSTKQGDLLTF